MKHGREKLVAVLVIFGLTFFILSPGLWLPLFGVIIEIGIVCAVARIVCKILFGRSLYEIIFGRRDNK